MNLSLLNNKKVGILGLGLENQALVKVLLKHKIKAEITICDRRDKKQLSENNQRLLRRPAKCGAPRNDIKWQLGKNFNKNLDKFDVLFRSPGWPTSPLIPLLIRRGKGAKRQGEVILSSPMKLFFDLCPTRNIIGVTGTKGKGTTASLVYEILKRAGKRAWLGGNIGVAPFEFIDKIKKNDWLVLELSSFQLEDLTVSPRIAVITNLSPEHLALDDLSNPNYHKTLKDYYNAKWNIVKYQNRGDKAVLNNNFKFKILNLKLRNKLLYFKKSELPSKLIGEHNKENIGAAVAVAKIVGVGQGVVKKAVADFKGLEHRLEFVREYKQIKYYEDSSATTPAAVMVALKSFAVPIVLLLGGADKGSDFTKLAKEVKRRAKFVILLSGRATPRIRRSLVGAGYEDRRMKLAHNMKEAVNLARGQAESGEVVLLSTACASFGLFKNYKERGDLFKKEVLKLK